jgi:hypothetical protein
MIVPVGLEGMKVTIRNPETGHPTRPFLRQSVKKEFSGSRRQDEYGSRIFNRLDDAYVERYYDPTTGEITFEKRGRRSDQSVHGERGKNRNG